MENSALRIYNLSRAPRNSLLLRAQGIGTAMIDFLEEYLLKHKGHKVFTCDGQALLYSSAEATAIESQAWHRAVGFKECGIIAGCNEGGIGEISFRKKLRAK